MKVQATTEIGPIIEMIETDMKIYNFNKFNI